MKLSVDPYLCNRTEYCVSVAPELFTFPADAFAPTATSADVTDPDAIARAEDAIGGCPLGAIEALR